MSYPFKLSLYTVILGLCSFLLTLLIEFKISFSVLSLVFAYFFSLSIITYYILQAVIIKNSKKFVTVFFLLKALKVALSLIVIFLFAYLFRNLAIEFALFFSLLYFFYTGFEAVSIMKVDKQS
jgi:hypothetical protein